MKKFFNKIAVLAAATLISPLTTGCLEEAFPENNQITGPQLEKIDKEGLALAISAYMTAYTSDSGLFWDCGFMGFGIWRDVMTADLPVYDNSYDYFRNYGTTINIGNSYVNEVFWQRYYYLIQKCDALLNVSDMDPEGPDAFYVGNALAYRAMAYFDMARFYEYQPTGFAVVDDLAESRHIYGLTVPIITEKTTEAEARVAPRAPFYEIYRFILSDLNLAEKCLKNYTSVTNKVDASLGVVYGLQARFWLELGTRFEESANDLALALQMEDSDLLNKYDHLAISTATDCYKKSADYARKAINSGYTPLTKSQWYDKVSGFNSPNDSWMWCISISSSNSLATTQTWQSFMSYMSPEATYGISTVEYCGGRCIDARLYSTISANDWRKNTWINPDDVGSEEAYNAKYKDVTSLTYADWAKFGQYVGFKFHPGSGNGETSTVGNVISEPLMRVEEMYLIEAEAVTRGQGAGSGKALLEAFMNGHRMEGGTYTCPSSQRAGVIDEIFKQKRIELWGEGLILWDYRRMKKAIERGYPGTNHTGIYRFNSYPGFVAPWTNIYIPDRVKNLNEKFELNPDPSQVVPLWQN